MKSTLRKDTKVRKNHFNVELALRNLQKIVHISKKVLFKLIQTKALKMAVFTNGGVLARLKIRHFQGFTVHCEKNITLLRIKSNAIWGFGTQDAICVQPLALLMAEILIKML